MDDNTNIKKSNPAISMLDGIKHKHSKKMIIIAAVIIVFIGLIAYGQYKKATRPIEYELVDAVLGDLVQTVEATGKIQSANALQLKFELSGKINDVRVKEGDQVKQNDILMKLNTADLDAAVAQASANLNQRLAGATKDDIAYYQSAVDLAKATLEQAKADGIHSIATAELAVQTAYNNLKLAEGGVNSEIVSNAYESAVVTLQSSVSTMDNSVTQADNILGVDNTVANDDFESYLGATDASKMPYAKIVYDNTKLLVDQAKLSISGLTTASERSIIDLALDKAELGLSKCSELLASVRDVLNATVPAGSLTQSTLDAKKTNIESTRSAANTQYNSVISARQNIETAKTSYTTYSIAYQKAQSDLENIKKTAESNIAIREASYNQAVASLNSKLNPPREVDVAALRAMLSQAIANRDKAILKAPIDGVVTKVYKKRGEFASMSENTIELLSPHFEIEVDVPETDVVKLKLQDIVSVTLDAYGDDVKFDGTVISIDPASTEIQDVVYYKIKVALDDAEREIKPGMTANVTVFTASREGVLHIPIRAVRTGDEGKYVRVLENGNPRDVNITLGIRADDGQVEITEGLEEGDKIILSVKEQN